MTDLEQRVIDDISAAFYRAVENVVESAAANVLKRYEETKGDTISQRQAEHEFGKKWLHDHIAVMGRELYHTAPFNPKTGSTNTKKMFSRAQLAEIRRKETDITVYQKFMLQLLALQRGALDNIYDNEPRGIREIHLKQRRVEKEVELSIIDRKIEQIGEERQASADRRKRRRR